MGGVRLPALSSPGDAYEYVQLMARLRTRMGPIRGFRTGTGATMERSERRGMHVKKRASHSLPIPISVSKYTTARINRRTRGI